MTKRAKIKAIHRAQRHGKRLAKQMNQNQRATAQPSAFDKHLGMDALSLMAALFKNK